MADTKITALTAISTVDPAVDVLPIVDVSDTTMAASGTTKKITSNQILGSGGTATLASATITGDLTVDTSTLKVDSANNRVGIGTATPTDLVHVLAPAGGGNVLLEGTAGNFPQFISKVGAKTWSSGYRSGTTAFELWEDSSQRYTIGNGGTPHTWYIGASTAMTLNSTGLGVGGSPTSKLTIFAGADGDVGFFRGGSTRQLQLGTSATAGYLNVDNASAGFELRVNGTARVYTDVAGNVGVGVTPSAWSSTYKALQVSSVAGLSCNSGSAEVLLSNNYFRAASQDQYITTNFATIYQQVSGSHRFYTAPSGTAGNAITFTQAMTLDASGNLLVGLTSGSYNRIKKDSTADAGNAIFELVGASNATSSIHYSVSSYNANAANAASKFGRDGVTLRSINAGGTVNASGADYAEYMVKCSDFVLAKGDVAGIDANGKLTNVFADAISFVVKSTDPSYVGNDKWGVGLEGADLESARQLVDRIAFAGQVPVNVTGAKAGDYIVPVANGTGIKGQAVSNPTFEQYQLAVGKVIGIDADGRARIIVKVA